MALLLLAVIGLLVVVCLLLVACLLLLGGGGGGGGGGRGVSGLPCPVAGAAGCAAALALSLASGLSLALSMESSSGGWVLLERRPKASKPGIAWRVRCFPFAANSGASLAGPLRLRPAPARAPPCAALSAMGGVGSASRTSGAADLFRI